MDNIDKKLINLIQNNFELIPAPYEKIGILLGISEEEVLTRLKRMKNEKILRYIGASIDYTNLNFNGILVAAKVPVGEIDKSASIINSHPGITHNYLRKDEYNMWFTISEPDSYDVEKTAKKILNLAKLKDYMLLKSEKKYKLNFSLNAYAKESDDLNFEKIKTKKIVKEIQINNIDRRIIEELKQPFPIINRPFYELSRKLEMSEEELLEKLLYYKNSGLIRKVGAIISQKELGYNYNALVLWNVEEHKIDFFAQKLSSFKNISHCYRRTEFPHWKFSIYSMIHCYDENHFEKLIQFLNEDENVLDYKILQTEKELKKKRMSFSDLEYEKWHKYNLINKLNSFKKEGNYERK